MITQPRPGQELKRLLNMKITQSCLCNARAMHMDVMGCKWCRENLSLIVEWLKEEHAFRVKQHKELLESGRRALKALDADLCGKINKAQADLGVTMKVGRLGPLVVIPFSPVIVRRIVCIAIGRAERCK